MNKNRLLAIPELRATGRIEQMNDSEMQKYIQKLEWFVDGIPVQEVLLRGALKEMDYDAISQTISYIWDMLIRIYADDLAEECFKQKNTIRNLREENLEAYITRFIATISALSIDIQMALYKEDAPEKVKEPAAEAPPAADAADDKDKPKDELPCVLAVDDSPFFLNSLSTLFKGAPFKLVSVRSGEAALKFLQRLNPSVFILDIDMPEMNGYELAEIIRARGYKSPIIFLTGNAKKEYVIKAIRVGASDFIVKPITKEQVFERIGKYVECSGCLNSEQGSEVCESSQ
jgi:CheY-like chemotaxis protein